MNAFRHADALNVYGPGQLFAFSAIDGSVDFDSCLVARTLTDAGLEVKLPARALLRFGPAPTECLLGGDFLEMTVEGQSIRAAMLDDAHLLIEGPCRPSEVAEEMAIRQDGARTLVAPASRMDESLLRADLDAALAARRRWLSERSIPANLDGPARRTLVKALSVMKTQVCSPAEHVRRRWTTPDRWPHRGCWLWDSAFHAIGWRHVDAALAREMISAVLDGQREDGFVPIRTLPGRHGHFTQPPVLAIAVDRVQRTDPDDAWLSEVFPKLEAYVTWDLANRDSDGAGLAEWAIESNRNCRSGESGMDNSPRFDAATALDATDFNSFLARECELLASFAEQLNRPARAEAWRRTHQKLCEQINLRLWSEELGLYVDRDVTTGKLTGVVANAGFLPLLCGAPTAGRAARMVSLLKDPRQFATEVPVPTIAASDTGNYTRDMWRGPVWININWLIAEGLDRYGYADLADHIRRASCAEIQRWYQAEGTIYEFYDDRGELCPARMPRKGKCAPEVHPYHQVIHDYGWSATLFADMVYEGKA